MYVQYVCVCVCERDQKSSIVRSTRVPTVQRVGFRIRWLEHVGGGGMLRCVLWSLRVEDVSFFRGQKYTL